MATHPFADGNGRVARALASVFMYRARSIPLLILAERQGEYLASLQAADSGDFQAFVDFTLDRSLEAMQLVQESMRAAIAPPADESISALKALYVTKGGYTHEEVDAAGHRLFEAVVSEAQTQLNSLQIPQITSSLSKGTAPRTSLLPNYRLPLVPGSSFVLGLQTKAPVRASVGIPFQLQVPKDCGREDDLVLFSSQTSEVFAARIDETTPSLSSVLQIRIRMFVQGLLSGLLAELAQKAHHDYRKP